MKEEKETSVEKKKTVRKKKAVIPQNELPLEVKSIPTEGSDNPNKRLATEKHPTIEAVINGLFKFEKKEHALSRLNAIKEHFVVSAKLPKEEDENIIKLWIRGFQIDADEEKEGFLGNYALIKIKEVDKKFSLIAEKQRIALKYHPQRRRPKRKHPDWGHPCMRVIKKGTVFETIEEAQKVLAQLHEEHPLVSIPAVNKLYVILYSKAYNPPIKKFVLEIKTAREGGFFIESKENNYVKKEPVVNTRSAEKPTENTGEKQDKGYFTSMVELRKSKKSQMKKPPARPVSTQSGNFSNKINIPTE